MFCKWFQFSHAIPNQSKEIIKTTNDCRINIVYLDHHLVKNNRIVALEKRHSKESYSLIISQNTSTPTSQQYFKTLLPHLYLDWKLINLLPRILTKNTSLRAFQYKVLNNVLYLDHKLFQFRVSTTSLCSYCNQHDETIQHFFSTYNKVLLLWTKIKLYFVSNIKLIALCPQIAIFGYTNTDDRCFMTQNLILLIFKFYGNKSRSSGNSSFSAFFHKLVKIKNLEKGAALRNGRKHSFKTTKKHSNKTIRFQ